MGAAPPSIPDMKSDHILVSDQPILQIPCCQKANAVAIIPLPESTQASLTCLFEVCQTTKQVYPSSCYQWSKFTQIEFTQIAS